MLIQLIKNHFNHFLIAFPETPKLLPTASKLEELINNVSSYFCSPGGIRTRSVSLTVPDPKSGASQPSFATEPYFCSLGRTRTDTSFDTTF